MITAHDIFPTTKKRGGVYLFGLSSTRLDDIRWFLCRFWKRPLLIGFTPPHVNVGSFLLLKRHWKSRHFDNRRTFWIALSSGPLALFSLGLSSPSSLLCIFFLPLLRCPFKRELASWHTSAVLRHRLFLHTSLLIATVSIPSAWHHTRWCMPQSVVRFRYTNIWLLSGLRARMIFSSLLYMYFVTRVVVWHWLWRHFFPCFTVSVLYLNSLFLFFYWFWGVFLGSCFRMFCRSNCPSLLAMGGVLLYIFLSHTKLNIYFTNLWLKCKVSCFFTCLSIIRSCCLVYRLEMLRIAK